MYIGFSYFCNVIIDFQIFFKIDNMDIKKIALIEPITVQKPI